MAFRKLPDEIVIRNSVLMVDKQDYCASLKVLHEGMVLVDVLKDSIRVSKTIIK